MSLKNYILSIRKKILNCKHFKKLLLLRSLIFFNNIIKKYTENYKFRLDIDRIDFNGPILKYFMLNPENIGVSENELSKKTNSQKFEFIYGEYLAKIASELGKCASELLFNSQWGYETPEWFDHRHHLLDFEKFFIDHWTYSAANVVRVLPYGGTLLDLCSGDGFYAYYFYRKRAKETVCIDANFEAYKQALRLHKADNIEYIYGDIINYILPKSHFDVISIRGAIEHFSNDDQLIIFRKAFDALKTGGWFCGDTPLNPNVGSKFLQAHEAEWRDTIEGKNCLLKVFNHIETETIESVDRATFFWRCKKV